VKVVNGLKYINIYIGPHASIGAKQVLILSHTIHHMILYFFTQHTECFLASTA